MKYSLNEKKKATNYTKYHISTFVATKVLSVSFCPVFQVFLKIFLI